MDPHCFDADPDLDPAQNLDADPDPGVGVGQPKCASPPGKILGTPLVARFSGTHFIFCPGSIFLMDPNPGPALYGKKNCKISSYKLISFDEKCYGYVSLRRSPKLWKPLGLPRPKKI